MNINIEKNNKIKKTITIIFCILCIIFLTIVYSRYKATSELKINEEKITNTLIPDSLHGTKLVQISDIHYGNTVDINYLKTIVNEINKIKPDILVLTGDLLDKEINEEEKNEIIYTLKEINVTISSYAIMGDSDYDEELWNEIITESGFINLNNKEEKIYSKSNEPILISNLDTFHDNIFSIYLLHQPDKVDELKNNFNLILAGHSLNGQINIPIIKLLLLPEGARKYYKNHYKINNSDLYISSGIGTTKFKYRFLNKPSIELYRLTNK